MSSYRILVVDDDPVQRETLRTYLELAEYGVEDASNGVEALEYLKSHGATDLVLMDVEMPEMDGFTAVKKMRATPEWRKVPVIFLTAVSRPHLKVKGLQLGADDYITKPFDRAELLARVKARLRARDVGENQVDLAGSLALMGVDTLLQSVCTSGRSGVIEFEALDAEVRFAPGELWRVRLGSHEGVEAVARLMIAGDTLFKVVFKEIKAGDGDEPVSVQQVLMDAAVMLDDVRRQLEVIAGGEEEQNPLLSIERDVDEFPELKRIQPLSPMHLHEMLIRMKGPLSVNSVTVAEAYRRNKVKVVQN